MRIVVIDDEKESVWQVLQEFARRGVDAVYFSSVAAAGEGLAQWIYEVDGIVLDMMMPGEGVYSRLGGLGFYKSISALEASLALDDKLPENGFPPVGVLTHVEISQFLGDLKEIHQKCPACLFRPWGKGVGAKKFVDEYIRWIEG